MHKLAALLQNKRRVYILAFLCLLVVSGLLKASIEVDRTALKMRKENMDPAEQVLSGFIGAFRETAATMLWIKMDSFFHSGNWQRLVPTVTLIQRLDPKFVQAWSVGAWHVSYNIGVPAKSVKTKVEMMRIGDDMVRKGLKYNPKVYDLYFELAWQRFDRQLDPARALPAFREAYAKPDAPHYVRHMLAHCLEQLGRIEESKALWRICVDNNECNPGLSNYTRLVNGEWRVDIAEYRMRNRGQEWERCSLDKIPVPEADIKAYYDKNKANYVQPEKVRVRHILVKNEEAAKNAMARLKEGADFAALAKSISADAATRTIGGNLGIIEHGQTVPEFEKAAFALREGQTSGIVKSKYGYHIIKAEAYFPKRFQTLEEATPTIKSHLADERLTDIVLAKYKAGERWGVPKIKLPAGLKLPPGYRNRG